MVIIWCGAPLSKFEPAKLRATRLSWEMIRKSSRPDRTPYQWSNEREVFEG
jgi:hypothetical protein